MPFLRKVNRLAKTPWLHIDRLRRVMSTLKNNLLRWVGYLAI